MLFLCASLRQQPSLSASPSLAAPVPQAARTSSIFWVMAQMAASRPSRLRGEDDDVFCRLTCSFAGLMLPCGPAMVTEGGRGAETTQTVAATAQRACWRERGGGEKEKEEETKGKLEFCRKF